MNDKTLSVFVDESGIWDESDESSRYYIVSFVLHDQTLDVAEAISSLERDLASIGIVNLCFHAAPIIRGNGTFSILSAELRRKIFSRMMGFARKVDFKYHCLCVDKHYCDTTQQMMDKLERQMSELVLTLRLIKRRGGQTPPLVALTRDHELPSHLRHGFAA